MYVGGLLYRIVMDSAYQMVNDALSDLGWFDDDRNHLPLQFLPKPLEQDEVVQPNCLTISMEDLDEEPMEMGSMLAEHSLEVFFDIYAESTSVGLHLAGDVKDLLEGRITSIDRIHPGFYVKDLTQANPDNLFYCLIEDVLFSRNRSSNKPHEKYWWEISCSFVFSYRDEDDNWELP